MGNNQPTELETQTDAKARNTDDRIMADCGWASGEHDGAWKEGAALPERMSPLFVVCIRAVAN